ncbi:MAG: PAS domain S-box protein [Chloroflexaceae bacterium]|nr:PAS domain S-box protein [Chloroflexaceae bacterium]
MTKTRFDLASQNSSSPTLLPQGTQGDGSNTTDHRPAPFQSGVDDTLRLRIIFERAAIGIAMADLQGRLLDMNPAFCEILGYRQDELYRMVLNEFTYPDDVTADLGLYRELLAGMRDVYNVEKRFIRKDQQVIWCRLTASLARDAQGKPRFAIAMLEDMTERRQTREALQESRERFHIFAYSAIGMALIGLDGRWLNVNRSMCEIVGYSEAELLRMTFQAITHPDDLDSDLEYIARLLHSNIRYYHKEKRYRHKMGHFVWVQVSVALVRNPSGEAAYLISNVQDITSRKQAEDQLRQSEERYRLLADNMRDLVCLHRSDGRIVYLSPSCHNLLGYDRGEMHGVSPCDVVHVEHRDRLNEVYNHIYKGVSSTSTTYLIRKKDGDYIWFETLIHAIRNSHGRVTYLQTSSRDISKRMQMQQELAQRARDLANSNAELEQFAFAASHDLQEPLSTMVGYLQLLERRYQGKLGTDADEYIEYAIDAANRMREQIEELLAYSRVTRRAKPLVETDLTDVVERAISNLQASISRHEAVIRYGPLPTVLADGSQLVQVLQNLIGNAIKYRSSQTPEIDIGAVRADDQAWTFFVRDNGIGISPEDTERIFFLFQRGDHDERRPGTGIGLALCKKIIERHGGRIWVESQVQKGSTFLFTIPDK